MIQRTLEVLEYNRIREEMAGYCMSEEGKSVFLERLPSTKPEEIRALKTLGAEWMRGLNAESPPQLRSWPPVRPLLSRLSVEGASLSLEEFYSLGLFCDAVVTFRTWAQRRQESVFSGRRDSLSLSGTPPSGALPTSALPSGALPTSAHSSGALPSADANLIAVCLELGDLSLPSNEIFRIIDRSGEIRDLPEIRAIKQGIRKIQQDIERLMGKYLGDETLKAALQSTLPTIRDGRQVIAIRTNFRNRVHGIVHEVSQSGQTVYMEPDDVVDRNNDLVTEEHRLSREVARILRELTSRIAPFHEAIELSLDRMVFLDGIGACARWGNENRCVFAEDIAFESAQPLSILQIRQGRHPLLRSRAVPIDLALVPGGRILIITGPNTGGKTVSLKTVALFALLNQSGWPIPASDPTRLPLFDYVGCDIGDEQSLDQSLSTFSGHMKNIATILSSATERSLVLLDELGSGTDPQEGSAIAMAVLDTLLERKATVLVTTHHGILKNYGYTHESCVNASVDFDQNTLSPTYRILMGVPGESHALDIASRNGLDPAIVDLARSYLLSERADVSALIKGLTAKHEELDRFGIEKKKEEQSLREKRRKSDLKELQLKQKELELREQGYRRLDGLFDDIRKQLENLVREIREGEMTREKTLQVKNWIADFEAHLNAEHDGLVAERDDTGTLRKEMEKRQLDEAGKDAASKDKLRRNRAAPRGEASGTSAGKRSGERIPEFEPGIEVYIGESKRRGTLVREAKKDQWIVVTGTLKMTVATAELSAVPVNGQGKKVSIEVNTDMGGDDVPSYELRLIGMRAEEAVKALGRQLDLASMKGLREFTIVHGKGNGVLQSAVHETLAAYGAVSEYHFARPEDGGTGKTYVRMG